MSDSCQHCQRKGLAILPALYAVAPSDVPMLPLATLSANYGLGVTDKPLSASSYYLRSLPAGYLYLLYPNNKWRGYLVDPKGLLLYYPDLMLADMPDAPPEKSVADTCKRQGHSSIAIQAFCIEDTTGPVWVAYSRHKWTKAVRKTHQANPAARMQKIAAVDGSAFPHAHVASATAIASHVADYQPALVKLLNNAGPQHVIAGRDSNTEVLAATMQALSGARKKPGLIMALHDPVGITVELNSRRNTLVEEVLALDQKVTAEERDDMMIAGIIDNLRESLQKNEGDWPRHYKRLDPKKYEPVLAKLKARAAHANRVEALSSDYVTWMTCAASKAALRLDYDGHDKTSALAYEADFVACTTGSGSTAQERDKVWQPWFDAPPDHEDNLLWKAASVNDQTILGELAWNKIDKTYDMTKGAVGVFKETEWYGQLRNAQAALGQRKAQWKEFSSVTEQLALTLAGQLQWLQSRDNKKYLRATAQFATVLLTRADLIMVPQNVRAQIHQYVRWAQEAYLAIPSIKVPLTTGTSTGNTARPRTVKPEKVANEELRKQVASLEGALMVDLSGKHQPVTFTAWVVSKLQPGKPLDPSLDDLFKRLKLNREAFVVPEKFKFNPLTSHQMEVKTARLDRAFSVGSGIFAFLSFRSAWNQVTDELKKGNAADRDKLLAGYAGVGLAIGSGIAIGIEIKAANKLILQQGVKTFGWKALTVTAAGLGLIVGITDAYITWKKSQKLAADGDMDAADLSLRSATAGGASAFAAFVGVGMSVFGITGIGLVVVFGFALVMGVVSVVSGLEASKVADTDVEKWLDRCRFGVRALPSNKVEFRNLEEKIVSLRRILYAVAMDVQTNNDMSVLTVYYSVKLPFHSKNTDVELFLFGTDPWGVERQIKRALFAAGALKPIETKEPIALAVDDLIPKSKSQVLTLEGRAVLRYPPFSLFRDSKTGRSMLQVGSVPVDVSSTPYFRSLRIVANYKPDTRTWPDFLVEASA